MRRVEFSSYLLCCIALFCILYLSAIYTSRGKTRFYVGKSGTSLVLETDSALKDYNAYIFMCSFVELSSKAEIHCSLVFANRVDPTFVDQENLKSTFRVLKPIT